MTAYVALLRGINLMGSTTLRMADLREIARSVGLGKVETYIASGNLLFESPLAEPELKALLTGALAQETGRDIGVIVRTVAELAGVAAANPFPERPTGHVLALFLDAAPAPDPAGRAKNRADEEIVAGRRELYIHYPQGQGKSRLALPEMKLGTGRNMNTVAKLVELLSR